jgi:hypothetical protein
VSFQTQHAPAKGNAMNQFISRYQDHISGTLSGFDRLVLRGHLPLNHDPGMKGYLWAHKVPWKDYAAHVDHVSQQVKHASLAIIEQANRPVRHLRDHTLSKENLARQIAAQDRIREGPVCAFTAVERCLSWRVTGHRDTRRLQLSRQMRQCLHIYHYWIDPLFGFMSARLQTWFPFSLYFYLNGREWLARQMDDARIGYHRHDNCFSWIEDFPRAQALMDQQLATNWTATLDERAQRTHPYLEHLSTLYPMRYYWCCFQSEWATDIVFRYPDQLRRLYPQLVHLGMTGFSSPDVMRFMDKKLTRRGEPVSPHAHEVVTDRKVRAEGVRIKHRLGANSIKLYDKAYSHSGAVLREELTLNAPEQFRVFRPKTGDDTGQLAWLRLRAGIADLHRRAQVSQQALDRYADALARVDDTIPLRDLTASVEKPVRWSRQRVRALHPFRRDDLELLLAVGRGEFTIHGLRNRDLRALLWATEPSDEREARRRSAAVSRKLRMLRAHRILRKLPHTHRYQVTARGRLLLNAIASAQRATTQQLANLAA